jgi:predicted membrane metal-binding protein
MDIYIYVHYIYIYISACISTEVSWSVSQLVGRRYIIYLTSYSLTIASTFGFISLIKINIPFSSIWFMWTYLAFNWFVSIMIISSKRGSLLLLFMNCIVSLLNQTSSLLDQYQLTTLCDNKMMIHSLFKFWLYFLIDHLRTAIHLLHSRSTAICDNPSLYLYNLLIISVTYMSSY